MKGSTYRRPASWLAHAVISHFRETVCWRPRWGCRSRRLYGSKSPRVWAKKACVRCGRMYLVTRKDNTPRRTSFRCDFVGDGESANVEQPAESSRRELPESAMFVACGLSCILLEELGWELRRRGCDVLCVLFGRGHANIWGSKLAHVVAVGLEMRQTRMDMYVWFSSSLSLDHQAKDALRYWKSRASCCAERASCCGSHPKCSPLLLGPLVTCCFKFIDKRFFISGKLSGVVSGSSRAAVINQRFRGR